MARPKKQLRLEVLEQAIADVKDRETRYGDPFTNHDRIATLFSAYQSCKVNGEVLPVDSIVFQILTNLARLIETPSNQDCWENIAGYAAIGAEVTND